MWMIYIISPVLNTSSNQKKGSTLLANGLVRTEEMYVGSKDTKKQAIRECLRLGVVTLEEKGYDTTVIGFGIRNRYAKRRSPFVFQVSIQELHRNLALRATKSSKENPLTLKKVRELLSVAC